MTSGVPNIVLVMSDQHRGDMMGCAGDAGVLTPTLDRLAAEGVRFSRVSCQGPLCMPARASFMTERYVRDHGVYTNWAEIAPDSPTYVWALREAGYHTALVGKAHLYRDEIHTAAHVDELADRLQRARVRRGARDGRQVQQLDAEPLHRPPARARAARGVPAAHRRPQLPRRQRERTERDEAGSDVGRDADAGSARRVHRQLARRRSGAVDRAVRATTSRSSCSSGSPDLTIRGTRLARRSIVTGTSTCRCRARRRARRSTAPGATARLLNSFLWLSDTETMTDDAIRGMRRAYSADISVIDDAVGGIVAALETPGTARQHVGDLHERPR